MGPPQSGFEQFLQVLTCVLTNSAMLPGLYMVIKRQRYDAAVVGFLTMSSSTIYHTLDTLGGTLFNMGATDWHVLDNVCALINLCQVMVMFMHNQHPKVDEALTWAFAMVTVFCMKIGPWNPVCTLIPLALPLLTLGCKILYTRRVPDMHKVQLGTAFGALGCAVVCFIKGLDDANDYLRLWHGFWHVFSAVFIFFSIKSNSKFDKRRMRLFAEGFGDLPWKNVRPGLLLGVATDMDSTKAS